LTPVRAFLTGLVREIFKNELLVYKDLYQIYFVHGDLRNATKSTCIRLRLSSFTKCIAVPPKIVAAAALKYSKSNIMLSYTLNWQARINGVTQSAPCASTFAPQSKAAKINSGLLRCIERHNKLVALDRDNVLFSMISGSGNNAGCSSGGR